jgi:uncharacterized membrane protein YccC
VHVQLNEYPLARGRYEAALPIYRDIGDRLGEANSLYGLFRVENGLVNLGSAADFAQRALALYGAIGTLQHPTAQHAQRWLEENREQIRDEVHAAETRAHLESLARPYSSLIEAIVNYGHGDSSLRAEVQRQLDDLRANPNTRELAEALGAIAFRGLRFEKRLIEYLERDEDRAVVRVTLHRLDDKLHAPASPPHALG